MEIKDMTISDIETRTAEIENEINSGNYDAEALDAEVDALTERKAQIVKEAEERKAKLEEIEATSRTFKDFEEERKMDNKEIRNTAPYIDAYANFIKTGKDAECRALLTEDASGGTVPVPEFVYEIVKNAWEKEGIMRLVKRTYIRGDLKVTFEISSDGAVLHAEGDDPIDPENLVLGVVKIVPQSIKKLVQISDEAYDLAGEDFLRYIYDEIAYQIAKKMADVLLDMITSAGTVSTATAVGVPAMTATPALGTVAQAMALLSDQAENPVVVMNRASWGALKAAQYTASFAADPFEGLPVLFNNSLKAFSAASTGDTWAIVGDFGNGALANFPKGEGIQFKFDDLTYKAKDMIEVLGREYVGLGIIAPDHFVNVIK